MPEPVSVYDATNDADLLGAVEAAQRVTAAYRDAQIVSVNLPPNPKLIGFDDGIYRQIKAAVESGKQHLMFYGPPGTGKTELARYVATKIAPDLDYTMLTGSADWSSQDLIGGYQPIGDGKIQFIPGILLKNLDKPLIIDELNRCDIDKVLGPLFTVLSNSETTLPYRVDVTKRDSENYRILGGYDPDAKDPVYSPHPNWRIIATINTIDKASLYQMSYALSRRFGWIFVDVPADLDAFVGTFLGRHAGQQLTPPVGGFAISKMWRSVNKLRPLGAAPFIDMIKHCRAVDPSFDFLVSPVDAAQADAYLDAFRVHVMPMLDGLMKIDLKSLGVDVLKILELQESDARGVAFERQLAAFGL